MARRATLKLECGLTLRFAALTQRGYYPHQPDKANQDAFSVVPSVTKEGHWFAVYDGHGPCGEKISGYASEHVSKRFKSAREAELKSVDDALSVAHLAANTEVANAPSIDDSQSGSTAVSVFVDSATGDVYVANVGDSLGDARHAARGEREDQGRRRSRRTRRRTGRTSARASRSTARAS